MSSMKYDKEYDYEPTQYNEEDVANKNVTKHKPHYYPSNRPQMLIRNAITGLPYEWRVGSNDQKQLFKTVDATGKYDSEGYFIRREKQRDDKTSALPNHATNHLFYDSPEQCMTHLNVKFEKSFIDAWRNKKTEFFSKD